MPEQMLTYTDLAERFKLSRSYIKINVANGTFPPPRRVGKKNVWFESDILMWMRSLQPNGPGTFCGDEY